jgi:putative glycosyltransferase (TIGR04372 family)
VTGGELRRTARVIGAFARKILVRLDLAFGVLIGVPIWLWSRHRPVQIQELWASRIGHLAMESEIFHWRRATGVTGAAKVVYFAQGPVSNAALLAKWRDFLPCGPAWLLGPAFRASGRFAWIDLRPSDWPRDSHSDLRLLDGRDPCWDFDEHERARGEALLHDLGIPSGMPYLCLAVRDGAYLRAVDTVRDWAYHDYRDSKIADYESMVARFVERGYAVVRMGRIVESAMHSDSPEVIDYANSSLRSDFADLWLFANCAFCITTSTGMDALASTKRRPLGFVNIPSTAALTLGNVSRLVMFKDIVDIHTGEVLGLLDERRRQAMAFNHISELTAMGLEFRDNTPAELAAFAVEMVDLLQGRWQPTPEQIEVEQEFLSRIPGPLDYTQANFHISPSWLRSHSQVE